MKGILTVLLLLVFLVGCTQVKTTIEKEEVAMEEKTMNEEKMQEKSAEMLKDIEVCKAEACPEGWKNYKLKDINSGETFKISDFKGNIVLLESFAVWCPICLRQQKEMKKILTVDGKEVIHISLDTDPNEDENQVKNHASRNGFEWKFVVSPIEVTQSLIDEFGIGVVNAPSAPVILICEDLSSRFLSRGVKTADELKEEIGKGC